MEDEMIELNLTADDAINITGVPLTGLRPFQWDEIAEEMNRILGGDWQVGKMGGKWILQDSSKMYRGSTTEYAALWKAMSVATGKAVIR